MFDVIAGTGVTTRRRGVMPLAISLASHIVVLVAILVPALFVMDALPELPTMMAFVAPVPPPPPPPPPPAPAAPAKPTKPAHAVSPNAAPLMTPDRIEPEAGIERFEQGVPGGVEGGIPGGVVGGIVGGISDAPPPAPPPPPAARQPVRVGGELSAPALILRVPPVYPEIAQRAHIQGLVILEAIVDERGSVTDVRVLRSIKFLDEAAVDAVRQWRYSPLLLNGQPMPFVLTVTVSFSVDGAAAVR